MKKLPIIVAYFCATLSLSQNSQSTEWKDDVLLQSRHASTDFFDFDAYDAQMASLDEADKKAERDMNTLYAPLDINIDTIRHALDESLIPQPIVQADLSGHAADEDMIMNEIIAASLRTAAIEKAKREVETARQRTIDINHKMGELIRIEKERSREHQEALRIYLDSSKPNPEIESMENSEEKARRLIEYAEQKATATQNWMRLFNLHQAAKADLAELEREDETVSDNYMALSRHFEDLRRQEDGLIGVPVVNQLPSSLSSSPQSGGKIND